MTLLERSHIIAYSDAARRAVGFEANKMRCCILYKIYYDGDEGENNNNSPREKDIRRNDNKLYVFPSVYI